MAIPFFYKSYNSPSQVQNKDKTSLRLPPLCVEEMFDVEKQKEKSKVKWFDEVIEN